MHLYHGHKFDIENLYEQIVDLVDREGGLQFKNGMWCLLHETKKIKDSETWRMSALKETMIQQVMKKIVDPENYFKSLKTKLSMAHKTIEIVLDGIVISEIDISGIYNKWAHGLME